MPAKQIGLGRARCGAITLLSTTGGKVRKVGSVNAGGLAEGVAFSPDGKYLYAANFMDNNLQIYRASGEKVRQTLIRHCPLTSEKCFC